MDEIHKDFFQHVLHGNHYSHYGKTTMDTRLSTFQYGQNIKHAHSHATWIIKSSISKA